MDPHAEGDADFEVELLAASGVVLDEEIELGAVVQNAEDDFGGEPGVARIEMGVATLGRRLTHAE